MKTCTRCGESRGIDEYHKDKRNKDGRVSRCKTCISEIKREYHARPEVKERVSTYKLSHRMSNLEEHRRRHREYYWTNRTEVRERQEGYYLKNAERIKAWNIAHHKENPNSRWESDFRRRSMTYGHKPVVVSFTKKELAETWGDACMDCGGEWSEVDHVIPVRFGGNHSIDNCQPVCRPCNMRRWHGYQKEAYDLMTQIYSGEAA